MCSQLESRKGTNWDEPIDKENLKDWQTWSSGLPNLENIEVARCYKAPGFESPKLTQVHVFCDASERGYSVSMYLRFVNRDGGIHCSLLLGKSRVAPLKKFTIPRMELTAATVAVHLYSKVSQELQYKIDEVYYWTDSMSSATSITHQLAFKRSWPIVYQS